MLKYFFGFMLNKTICELKGILFHCVNQENSVVVHYILVASYVLFVISLDKTLHMNSCCCCMSWVSRGLSVSCGLYIRIIL